MGGFSNLDAAWQRALTQAWRAHVLGNIGVGAVLTDRTGFIVGEGRNRVVDTTAPPGRLHGNYLAHAEMDVLALLPVGDYEHHTIWTTLEPCLLCMSAIVTSHVGVVRFAAPDPLWLGLDRLREVNAQADKHWPERIGPMTGPMAAFCAMLPMVWFFRNQGGGAANRAYESDHAGLVDLAQRLAGENTLDVLGGEPVEAVLERLGPDLVEAGG
ncbi:MAG: nucleoside deaminase [Acidimicrobiia bacterium]|nr:nucleoside deaminase [Acidimicrobiia bacterium]MDH3426672.1 nucleoside deaminase [Acidimicrobiia bacterium]MDH5615247.1 nucleoside deaminase [Acidimicrobiia bacterium]